MFSKEFFFCKVLGGFLLRFIGLDLVLSTRRSRFLGIVVLFRVLWESWDLKSSLEFLLFCFVVCFSVGVRFG